MSVPFLKSTNLCIYQLLFKKLKLKCKKIELSKLIIMAKVVVFFNSVSAVIRALKLLHVL